jgi:hypothetical protein
MCGWWGVPMWGFWWILPLVGLLVCVGLFVAALRFLIAGRGCLCMGGHAGHATGGSAQGSSSPST